MRTRRPIEQQAWRELLTAHQEQLREWAENYPPTFADKHALVSAEIARLEKRDADAHATCTSRLSIRLARTASFKTRRWPMNWRRSSTWRAASKRPAYTYLRNARNCYDRWGAHGKVKQLDERYPRLREERTLASSATIGTPVGQLDVETVVKASQATFERDGPSQADREAHANRGGACRG